MTTGDGKDLVENMMTCDRLRSLNREHTENETIHKTEAEEVTLYTDIPQIELPTDEIHALKYDGYISKTAPAPKFLIESNYAEYKAKLRLKLEFFYKNSDSIVLTEPVIDQLVIAKLGHGELIRARILEITLSAKKLLIQNVDDLELLQAYFDDCRIVEKNDEVVEKFSSMTVQIKNPSSGGFDSDFIGYMERLNVILNDDASKSVYFENSVYCLTKEGHIFNVDTAYQNFKKGQNGQNDEYAENNHLSVPTSVRIFFNPNFTEEDSFISEPPKTTESPEFDLCKFKEKFCADKVYKNLLGNHSKKIGVIVTNIQREIWGQKNNHPSEKRDSVQQGPEKS